VVAVNYCYTIDHHIGSSLKSLEVHFQITRQFTHRHMPYFNRFHNYNSINHTVYNFPRYRSIHSDRSFITLRNFPIHSRNMATLHFLQLYFLV